MGVSDFLMNIVREHERNRHAALDTEIAGLVFTPDPSHLGRVIRSRLIEHPREAYMIPGNMFADGKARLIVSPDATVNEEAQTWPDA